MEFCFRIRGNYVLFRVLFGFFLNVFILGVMIGVLARREFWVNSLVFLEFNIFLLVGFRGYFFGVKGI